MWTITLGTLSEDSYNLSVTSRDIIGNISVVNSLTLIIDTTAPSAPLLFAPLNHTLINVSTPILTGTGEPWSLFTITSGSGNLIGTGVVDFSGNYTFTPLSSLPEGSNTIQVTTTDAAGNISVATSRTFTIDSIPPDTLSGTTAPLGLSGAIIAVKNITVAFSSETGAIFQCSLDGLAYTGCTSPVPYTSLAEGIHTILIRAVDLATNIDPTPLTISFTVNSNNIGGG
jgi:large repetitive protein